MNKIVALWCHPRSMSTSVERLMRERGDFECLHEPFMYHYYLNQKHRQMPYFDPQTNHPLRYEDVRDMVLEKAKHSAVFFKDMAYYIDNDITKDDNFCRSITHCFLIRNPQASIASYYKLDNEVTLAEIGLEAQWRLFCHLTDMGVEPVVLQAEDIRKDTQTVVGSWWAGIGIDYTEAAFNWNEVSPQDWKQVEGWHQQSIESTSIRPWGPEDAKRESKRFQVAVRQAPHLQSYLDHQSRFYRLLKEQVSTSF